MRIRTLAAALSLSLLGALAVPATAEAGHRHSRDCRHGHRHYYSGSYRTPRHYAPRHHERRYYDDHYRGDYGGYYYERRYHYRPSPRVRHHYHGHSRCSRPHVSLRLGW
ncbi:MAG: hypothetical protein HY317_01725 [Acidobacteria bacterium]|nr:hypothetical protein [Acidobacteriota bacterium]